MQVTEKQDSLPALSPGVLEKRISEYTAKSTDYLIKKWGCRALARQPIMILSG